MIVINVNSEIVEARRVFDADGPSIKYLKCIRSLHDNARLQAVGPPPIYRNYKGRGRKRKYLNDRQKWQSEISTAIPLKIEITHEN